ncbi:MAG: SRPBCC family protein, partial [Nocardioidaceae bacterium]
MPLLDLVDETYVVAGPARLRTLLCDEQAWRTWFPDLALRCFDDRAELGKRWTVSGALVGTCEIWLERSV